MAEFNPERAYRPIDADTSAGPGALLRPLASLVLAACAVALFAPSMLRFVVPEWHGGPLAELYVRLVAFGVLAVTLAVSGLRGQLRLQRKQREAWRTFADQVGGDVSVGSALPAGMPGGGAGERVAYTVEGRPVLLTCYSPQGSTHFTRLGATLPLGRDVQLQVLANSTANRVLMSARIWSPILSAAAREAGDGSEGAERAAALERMRFLTADPLATGDAAFDRAFLVKATDEGIARDMAAAPSVREALEALAKRDRYFRLTLVALRAPGPAQLEVELAGRVADVERLRCMHELLSAVMARLDRSGVLEAPRRRAS
ncbi:MAG TPA: hypothetical protein VID50_03920 [Candidatus Eisenbacteria bacterium]|jgi:hypothetical protein